MKRFTFKAQVRSDQTPLVTGWQLRDGAVVHRQLTASRFGLRDDAWTISDPVSGLAFVHGWSMGAAMARYRDLQSKYGAGFAKHVAVARQRRARQIAAERAAS